MLNFTQTLFTCVNVYFDSWFCRYEGVDKQLQVGIEQARNLAALPFPEGSKV